MDYIISPITTYDRLNEYNDDLEFGRISEQTGRNEFEIISSCYYQNLLHKLNGPAEIRRDGCSYYYMGQLHRTDGPAYISNGMEEWYELGINHRLRGPAITYANGLEEWVVNGRNVTLEAEKFSLRNAKPWQTWDEHAWGLFNDHIEASAAI